MSYLKIPYAMNDQGFISTPMKAIKGLTYYCCECRNVVVFKKGELNAPHFAHKPSNSCGMILDKKPASAPEFLVNVIECEKISISPDVATPVIIP